MSRAPLPRAALRAFAPGALILATPLTSCIADPPPANPTRETLPNGAILVRYPDLPAIDSAGPEITEATMALRFGSRDGTDPTLAFSDIRGIDADSDGNIFVLDQQAAEVRAFDPEGRYLRTIARRGRGPGEIMEANGILLSGDTLLWMHDHGQHAIIGVDPRGFEVRRFPKPVDEYRGYWTGTFDSRGRYWREVSQRDAAATYSDEGVNTNVTRDFYKSYDLSSGAVDSVFLGVSTSRSYSYAAAGGTGFLRIPFQSGNMSAVNPAGGFWHAHGASYRITRTGEDGDTLVVIEAGLPVQRVTDADRSSYVERMVEGQPDVRRHAEAVADAMPDVKPILTGLFVDDEGRLWVQRATPAEVPAFYDTFSEDGDYLGSVRFTFEPGRIIRVRHGNIYTWVEDEMDIPYVVRAPVW